MGEFGDYGKDLLMMEFSITLQNFDTNFTDLKSSEKKSPMWNFIDKNLIPFFLIQLFVAISLFLKCLKNIGEEFSSYRAGKILELVLKVAESGMQISKF